MFPLTSTQRCRSRSCRKCGRREARRGQRRSVTHESESTKVAKHGLATYRADISSRVCIAGQLSNVADDVVVGQHNTCRQHDLYFKIARKLKRRILTLGEARSAGRERNNSDMFLGVDLHLRLGHVLTGEQTVTFAEDEHLELQQLQREDTETKPFVYLLHGSLFGNSHRHILKVGDGNQELGLGQFELVVQLLLLV